MNLWYNQSMHRFGALFTGIFGLIFFVILISMIIMWFSAPILLYGIYQQLKILNEKLNK